MAGKQEGGQGGGHMQPGQNAGDTVYMQPPRKSGFRGTGKLIIIDEGEFHEIDLASFGKDRLNIGRDPAKNDIVLRSPIVSGVHGRLKLEGGRMFLADVGSKNGIYQKKANRFQKIDPMKYHWLSAAENIFRIDMPEADQNQKHTVVLFFKSGEYPGSWKRVGMDKPQMTIGRAQGNDIVLGQASVTRCHAVLRRLAGGMAITDNNSRNGVFINGIRLSGTYQLCDKDIIQIASTTMFVVGNRLIYKARGSGISLETRDLCKTVGKGKKAHMILDHVDCRIDNNEFVAIIGGSGAGKTTLMTALSGFDDKVSGTVLCNGIRLHENFSSLKNIIGFVPQQDIIYENLTLRKMLSYTAKMKMPEDTTKEEMAERIDKVLAMVELTEHQDKFIRKLSGGQKKRASIAVELLADPGLFFLDEPTSGLDPGTEQKLMQTLSRLSKQEEKTIVMVTHTTQSLHLCDKIIIMGSGGRLCFSGTPQQAKRFFHTEDLVDIYNFVTDDSQKWSGRFRQLQAAAPQPEPPAAGRKIPEKRTSMLRQLSVLTLRYMELIRNDKQRLLLLLLQPFLVALLLNVVAGKEIFRQYEQTKSIMFALACSGIWIGMFNTIQEICKERVILKREYMGNLRLGMYILSKYIVQSLICLVQGAILSGVFLALCKNDLKKGLFFEAAEIEVFLTMFFTILASAAIGLIISAFVRNADRAMAVAPFVLIVQLLFSGILFELKGMSKKISILTISRWSVESLGNIARLNKLTLKMQEQYPIEHKAEAIFKHTREHLGETWMIMLFMAVGCAFISMIVLRNLRNDQR